MESVSSTPLSRRTIRPYAPAELPTVPALIDEARLPGRPRATPELFTEASRGSTEADGHGWGAYEGPETYVAVDSDGGIVGAVACARRTKDGAGLTPSLRCREDPMTADALLSHVSAALSSMSARFVDVDHLRSYALRVPVIRV
ncbi:hypothetical protein PV390_21415 [Streptomyces sp. ME02-6991-2A]|uniref:hypothetical protein n=1 Tax=Streptomyces TaxID=1883 RepID=UPI00100846C9|nr:hypothetical protein [Streptomyces sp. ME02-6991-2A]MDX3376958.1 hypothetical protein [Streptomyces sp. ME02-6991-2A]